MDSGRTGRARRRGPGRVIFCQKTRKTAGTGAAAGAPGPGNTSAGAAEVSGGPGSGPAGVAGVPRRAGAPSAGAAVVPGASGRNAAGSAAAFRGAETSPAGTAEVPGGPGKGPAGAAEAFSGAAIPSAAPVAAWGAAGKFSARSVPAVFSDPVRGILHAPAFQKSPPAASGCAMDRNSGNTTVARDDRLLSRGRSVTELSPGCRSPNTSSEPVLEI